MPITHAITHPIKKLDTKNDKSSLNFIFIEDANSSLRLSVSIDR